MNDLKSRVYALKAIAPIPLLMANRRKEAIGYALAALKLQPLRLRNWAVFAAAFVGPAAVILRRWTAPH